MTFSHCSSCILTYNLSWIVHKPPKIHESFIPRTFRTTLIPEVELREFLSFIWGIFFRGLTVYSFICAFSSPISSPFLSPITAETFANLLLLYIKHDYYDLAADVLAENSHLTFKCLSTYLYDFIDTKITQQTSPDEVYILHMLILLACLSVGNELV